MTPEADKLRECAAFLLDEAARLHRELRRPTPRTHIASLHLANAHQAVCDMWAGGLKFDDLKEVPQAEHLMSEYAVAPPVETRARKKEQRRRVQI